MGLYNFKDKYTNYLSEKVEDLYTTLFYSSLGVNGTGSRSVPLSSKDINTGPGNIGTIAKIYGSGIHSIKYYNSSYGTAGTVYNIGSGIGNTLFRGIFSSNTNVDRYHHFKDITFLDVSISSQWVTNVQYWMFYNCEITRAFDIPDVDRIDNIRNCILRTQYNKGNSNSYVGVNGSTISNYNLNLYDNCGVFIASQADVNASVSRYTAFNNCNFRIGAESDFVPLAGSTAAELRQSFVDRCAAQGYTVPSITEYSETLQAGRWIFSNNSAVEGLVLKDSVIHNFEKRRLIYFGYSDFRSDKIAITTDKSKPAAFSSGYANSSIAVTNDSIALASNIDISKAVKGQADTNIIWLGGKYQLNRLDIIHNFPKIYGVFVDSSSSLSSVPVNKNTGIEPYGNGASRTYIVRSNDDLEATIIYNGVPYSSSVYARNNTFRGVDGVASFTTVTTNAVVYEILDEVMHQTMQMRIVNKIPTGNIAAGTPLADGYWYLVEHDTDQGNATDYVTYGGSNYKVGSSFIASGTGAFVKTGNVHLRRCWKDDFVYDTETLDKAFWTNEQKPKWFDVLPDDLRCLMKNNNGNEQEMQSDADATYIASGHADFYNDILGVTGVVKPSYPIQGAYMQLRLVITTQNPM